MRLMLVTGLWRGDGGSLCPSGSSEERKSYPHKYTSALLHAGQCDHVQNVHWQSSLAIDLFCG